MVETGKTQKTITTGDKTAESVSEKIRLLLISKGSIDVVGNEAGRFLPVLKIILLKQGSKSGHSHVVLIITPGYYQWVNAQLVLKSLMMV